MGEAVVGIEASGYSTWFVELLEWLGHRVLIGDAAEVRRLAKRRQKNDRRDASLILDLLLKGEFPQVHRPSFESREVLRLLRHRHKLVQLRTRARNSLQAVAFSAGSSGRSRLLSREGRRQFVQLPMSEAMSRQRDGWLSFIDDLNARLKELDAWLEQQARRDERVMRLQTHPGIGLLTSLALAHALEPVTRFAGGRKVAAYVGFDPMEHSSGERRGSAPSARAAQGCCAICGGGADRGEVRRGAQAVLPAAPAPPRRAEGAGRGGAQAVNPGLYPFT